MRDSARLLRSALLLTVSVACAPTGQRRGTQSPNDQSLVARVDSVFADIASGAPGCAVGVYRDGQLTLSRNYGVTNVEDGRRITSRTNFDLGSAGKQFTALATLMLESQRRISLDDDVRQYVPELPDYGTPIRIRDLLQHTSGLRDYGTLDLLAGRETRTMAEFRTALASQQRLNLTPGTKHEYSHSDFELLGLIIERVVGQPFGAYLEREVLRPIGMVNTRVEDARGVRVPDRAFGHAPSAGGVRVVFNSSEVAGGGNLYTSVEDLMHWDRALADAAAGERPLVARMLTRPTMPSGDTIPYAYGVRTESYRGLPTIARGGHSSGMTSEIIRFPNQQLAVVALCNIDGVWAGPRAQRVADVFLAGVAEASPRSVGYRAPPAAPISAAALQEFAGVYHSSGELDHSVVAIRGGKLFELFGDTAQAFTHRGGGVFSADDIPGDFRLAFRRSAVGTIQMDHVSSGEVVAT